MSSESHERAERLLIDTIRCLPGYSSCGDISVERRVRAECAALLCDRMPQPVFGSSCRYWDCGWCYHVDNDRGSCPGWKNCNIEGKRVSEANPLDRFVISRVWEMPNKWTFKMRCIQAMFDRVISGEWADPFAGHYSPAKYRNDIEGDRNSTHQMDALDFLKSLEDESVDGVLFDPPYSVEQCLRKYTPKFKGTAGRAEYWARCKDEIKRVVKPGGMAISFCWDSTGIGKKRGFNQVEVMLICHGACHNDTIVTVERKGL